MGIKNINISNELRLLLLLTKKEVAFNINKNLENEQIYKLINNDINWKLFFQYANIYSLIPLVYTSISQIESHKIPDWIINRFKKEYEKKRIGIIIQSAEIIRICKLFESNNIRFFILKGIPLALTIYGNITLRESSDIDFFIHRDDLSRAIELINDEKYIHLNDEYGDVLKNIKENNEEYLSKYHHMDYIHPTRGIKLELHWKLSKTYFFIMLNDFSDVFSFNNLWDNRNEIVFSSNKLYKFCLEDELLYLVYHATTHRYMRLKWLLDIYELLNKYKEIKWNELIIKSKKTSLLKALALSIMLCSIYFDLNIEKVKDVAESDELNAVVESKKIIRSIKIFSNFIVPNIFKLYNSEGTMLFKLKKRINYTLWKVSLNNEDKKALVLLNDMKIFISDILRKANVIKKYTMLQK